MMNNKLILGAFISIIVCSCSQESDNFDRLANVQGQIMELSSRTYLDNGNVIWKEGDAISVFIKTGYHHQYELSTGAESSVATFSYKSSVGNSNKIDYHYAIYPYSQNHVLNSDNTIYVDLTSWAIQNYTENSFEDDKSFMTGKSSQLSFPFYNAHSMAKVKLSSVVPGSYSVSSIAFSSASAALNGNAIIDMTTDKPILVLTDNDIESCRTNTLLSSSIILTDEPTEFYVLMPVGTYNDLTLTVKGLNEMDGTELLWSKSYNYPINFRRSLIETFNHQFDPVDFSGEIKPD